MRIVKTVKERQFVSVNELIQMLGCSRSSVIRDLDALQEKGLLVRQRGGASLRSGTEMLNAWSEQSVFEKADQQVEAKKAICAKAAEKLEDGQCIYLDSGTTAAYLMPYLLNKKVIVVTPSVYVLRNFSNQMDGEIILLGGQYHPDYDMSVGPLSEQMLEQFRFDAAFLTANGVDVAKKEVYAVDFRLGSVKSKVLQRTQHRYLLVDHTKFQISAPCQWGTTEDFETIITDQYPKKGRPKQIQVAGKEKHENK